MVVTVITSNIFDISCCGFHVKDTVDHLQGVVSPGHGWHHAVAWRLDDAVEFAEGRQGGGPHPHDEVLVDEAVIIRSGVQLVDGSAPVQRLRCT